MVAGFHSFHWEGCELPDAELEQAHHELMAPTEEQAYLRAFRTLLHSGNTIAAGIALDHFQYSGALTRFGGESVVEQYGPDVLAVARELLRRPPTPEDEDTFAGANHASALNAMMNIAEPADADLIADALALATNANVRSAACSAAATALDAAETPSPRLVAALGAVAFDESLEDMGERTEALHAVFEADDPEATALLVRATESGERRMQVYGALGLTTNGRFHDHRERVERLAATWPQDAQYPASLVREALTGFHSIYWLGTRLDSDPELERAHAELMFPTGSEDAYHRAFRTLLHSGNPAAAGIALDYFQSWQGLGNLLHEDEIEAYAPEVVARAWEVLGDPPSPPELSPDTGEAANHISALNAIGARWPQPSDARLIAEVLERATSDGVRDKALWVAYGVLDTDDADEASVGDDEPDRERLVDIVSRFVFDPSLSGHHETALRVLGEALGPEANPLLLRALAGDDWDIHVQAAWRLSRPERIDEHRELLEETVEGWPVEVMSSAHDADLVRRAVFGGMHSVHWEGHRLADPGLCRAHRELRTPGDEDTYHRALRTLLDSGQEVAVGIALDHWFHDKGLERHFGEQARAIDTPQVLARAREALRRPPSPAGANHLSALNALRVARSWEPGDAALLAGVLRQATDPEVHSCALYTVSGFLYETNAADGELISTLGALARDESLPVSQRTSALGSLRDAPGNAATEELVRATGCEELEVQATAALGLTDEPRLADHRALLSRLVAQWPTEGAPWAADFVREALEAQD
ncbi:hypothetical protein [Streptomyces lonegramiae]|uniref:HEAT repeat domain-containing protein n=1 Tax=Streptomyces lonegramiae TaxID=3075524 RepID=A0ABU2XFL6_9ACTN|nr:hypothetical protein [Streptomyces sp. DSM 41529]MDT0544681.1 hypothetical protein [Streptomyces sp. DSM 41529]